MRFTENVLRTVPRGRIAATGSVLLHIGDDVTTTANSEIAAGAAIDIYGDWGNGDPHFGTTMILRGTITPGANSLTRIWGDTDVDTFQFGDAGGIGGTTTLDSPGYILLGGKTRVFGNAGEDLFTVDYLQTMNVAAGHTLTLDGQAGSDRYEIYTTGTQGSQRNYVVNLLDTGAPNDGVDEAAIYGRDTIYAAPAPAGSSYEADDIFLLRAATSIPSELADHPGYVALLAGSGGAPVSSALSCAAGNDLDCYRDTITGNEPSTFVQRINYDTGLNGRLSVYGQGGNDAFFTDDTTAIVTLDGGADDDTFQIGQVFGSKRDVANGGLAASDVFPVLIATTQGWLSPGTHAPLIAQGGSGNDQFIVYSNQAELRLEGDDGNDSFTVRAFALAEVANGAIVLGANGLPKPALGASTARPLDIRGGAGDDDVTYNVNAPVSLDGGTGFNKVVVLGTEFADQIVITAAGILGAGVNVRYSNMQVIEVDGLEGDDTFYVQSTAYGVAYRVIGGLGSDTINVTGDVTSDIVVKDLEGLHGAINHIVSSGDVRYDGLLVDGVNVNVATPTAGNVIITETDGSTTVREGTDGLRIDRYDVRLATAPTGPVYVTVSAGRSSQQESDGDTVWLCTGTSDADCDDPSEFKRYVYVNSGTQTGVAQRSVVLTFDAGNWNVNQRVYVLAVDDPRSEGTRVVVINHSVISTDARFDGTLVRNVEVTVRDNDTPGVEVEQVQPGTSTVDDRTVVIEGNTTTALRDELLVRLAAAPAGGTVTLHLVLDAASDQAISISSADARYDATTRTLKFTAADWDDAIRLVITPRDNAVREDPRTAVIEFSADDPAYVFPSQRVAVQVLDDETAGVLVTESGGSTLVVQGGATDDVLMRLTGQPTADVRVAITTDGLTDVKSINGVPVALTPIGGYVPTQLFGGTVTVGTAGGRTTITRNIVGSFVSDGFTTGQLIRIAGLGAANGDRHILSVTATTITLTEATGASGTFSGAIVSKLVLQGLWTGAATFDTVNRRLVRADGASFLADGFLEGQRVRVCTTDGATCADFKIGVVRGDNATQDDKLEFTSEGAFPFNAGASVTVTRLAAVATFSGDVNAANAWYKQQRIEYVADSAYSLAPGRENLVQLAASAHLLTNLLGPLTIDGGVGPDDRSLRNGVKLAGERDTALFGLPPQPPESTRIDIVNVYDDSSQADGNGTLTGTSLNGLGLPGGLTFSGGTAFGELAQVPSGITYANIEELNIHLGTGNDTFTIETTHVGTTNVTGNDGDDTFLIKTVSGHTTIESGFGNDKITVRNDEGTVDQIAALLTIDTGGGTDVVNVDDAADTNDNTGILTGSTLTGLDMPTSPLTQVISIHAASGRYRLERTDTHAFVELDFNATADQVAAALRTLFGTPDLKVSLDRSNGTATYTVTFIREAAGLSFAPLGFLDTTQLIAAAGQSVSVNAAPQTRAAAVGIVQTLTLAATGGTYQLHFVRRDPVTGLLRNYTTAPIAYNASEADVLAAVSAILNPTNTDPTMSFTNNVTVRRFGNTYQLLFRGEDTATTIAWVDTGALTGTLALATRVNGINYYGIETLNIDLGSGDDVFNVQGTTATTNLSLAAGDERVYVASGANYGLADHPDYLYGNLDQVLGALNIDAGTGRHQLMISDESSLVGDSDVRITDAPGSEILVSGLAPAPITYKAAPGGNFADGITIWAGSGNDRIHVDATHLRAGVRTVTSLNTGLGNDEVWVDLHPGSDDSFVLDTQGGYDSVYGVAGGLRAGDTNTPADSVRAWIDGAAVPVAYQPDGLVRLLRSGRPDAPVVIEITRTYKQAFVLGAGNTVTFTNLALAAGDTVTVTLNGAPVAFTRNGSTLTLQGATANALVIVTVVRVELQNFTLSAAYSQSADDDIVHAQTSTLPLIIFGGQGNDVIDGGSGGDVIFGDRGRVLYYDPTRPLPAFGDPLPDMARLAEWEAAAVSVYGHGGSGDFTDGVARGIGLAMSADFQIGGNDTITTLGGNDVVVGGAGNDVLNTGAGDDIAFGDSGRVAAGDRTGLELAPLASIPGLVTTIAPRTGGDDRIYTGTGNDVALGGNGADVLVLGEGDDIGLGDHGGLLYSDTLPAGARLWQIYTSDFHDGGLDRLEGEAGDDLLIGGTGGDAIDGDAGDDLIFGDQVSLQRQLAARSRCASRPRRTERSTRTTAPRRRRSTASPASTPGTSRAGRSTRCSTSSSRPRCRTPRRSRASPPASATTTSPAARATT